MRNQPDETLLTHWQDELERTQGDLKLATRVPLEARRRLAEKYQFIVYRPNRDYMQAANEALLRCINTCKPSKSFKTFARPAISRAIRDYKQSKESGESGAVYRPNDSDDSFKYPSKWYRPGQKAMLLASEATDGDGGSDLSFDCRYYGDEDDDEGYEMIEEFEHAANTFDRQRNAERIELDRRLSVLDPRERHIIEKRHMINECREVFERVKDYINEGVNLEVPNEQADLAELFGVSARRISQIEAAAVAKLKEVKSAQLHMSIYGPTSRASHKALGKVARTWSPGSRIGRLTLSC